MLKFPYLTNLTEGVRVREVGGCIFWCPVNWHRQQGAATLKHQRNIQHQPVQLNVKHCRCDKFCQSAVFLCSRKPCSRAVNIFSCRYARQLMWDLILPVFLLRLSFMSLHLFMVTSAWTHQSCAISILGGIAGNNIYTTRFHMKAFTSVGGDILAFNDRNKQ